MNREILLETSYRNAVLQAKKTRLNPDSNFFFLEDTSVSISSLGTSEQEIPGVDIKYWMQNTSFSELDKSLKTQDNNRTVSVRSDIVLHLPHQFRKINELNFEYIVFTGVQEGNVTSEETTYTTNLVYPWLDNQTFNKWFVPNGESDVLGSLDVEIANKYDFRRKAFDQMISFLASYGLLEDQETQRRLPLEIPSIITGYSCAGKTEASQYLAKHHKHLHIEASDFMYLNYYMRHGYQGEVSIGDFAEQALRDKPHIVAERIAEYLESVPTMPVVISGFRSPAEIRWLEKRLSISDNGLKTLFIHAEQNIRFERLLERRRAGDDINFEKFSRRDDQQARMGLDEIRDNKQNIFIDNQDTLSSYYHLVATSIGVETADVVHDSESVWNLVFPNKNIKLESAILISLLSVWVKTEGGEYFTTSEISKLIRTVFPEIISPKHKDNISRYFNQEFRPYYEINGSELDHKRRYRLSNTGYGKALTILQDLQAL